MNVSFWRHILCVRDNFKSRIKKVKCALFLQNMTHSAEQMMDLSLLLYSVIFVLLTAVSNTSVDRINTF